MTFKELKPGDYIYVIDKVNAKANFVKINSITPSVGLQPGQIGIFKDINVTIDNINKSYTVNEIWDTALADNTNTVITPNVERALTEIKGMKKQNEDIVSNIDKYKENIAKCDNLLSELDPSFKKEQAYEKRFSKLEEAYAKQEKNYTDIKELLTKLLEK